MEWLGYEVFDNLVRNWLVAAATAAGAFLVLHLIKHILLRRFEKRAAETETLADDFIISILRRSRRFLILLAAIWLGSLALALPPRAETLLRTLAILAVLLQVSLWAVTAINFWVEHTRKKRLASDAASASLIGVAGFAGKLIILASLFLVALDNLGVDVTALVAGLGIGGIAVGLALQNILGDLLASISIALDKPFVIGDTIHVGEYVGTVESIGLKTTHLRSLSGEQLIFSNGDLLQSRIRNYKRMAERRVVFTFGVVYHTPVGTVEAIPEMVRSIIEAQDEVRFDRSHFKTFGDSSLDFETVYYVLSPDFGFYMDRQQRINLAVMRRFEEEGIEFAFPTRTVLIAGQNPAKENSCAK